MADDRLVQEWLEKADDDLAFAQVNLEEGRTYYAQICFHFQQSAEKYLKAIIVARDLEFRKIHDLIVLLNQCATVAPALEELREDCQYLSAFYIEARYPVHWPTNFTQGEAVKAFQAASRIKSLIKSTLKSFFSQS